MELRQLRYFIAVADNLNFSRAAESLYISQSSLSQQIADLEREIGVDLLKRSKRSVELTEPGKTMLRLARNLLNSVEKLVPEVRYIAQTETMDRDIYFGLDNSLELHYHVNYHSSFRVPLTSVIYETYKTFPGFRPTFEMFEHEQLVRALDIGTVDLGFFLHYSKTVSGSGELVAQILRQDEMVLVLRSEEEIDDTLDNVREVLKSRGLMLLERETKGMGQVLRILDAIGVEPSIRFCDTRMVMVLSAECGECATILPTSVAAGLNDPALKLLHFRTPLAIRYLLAVWRKDNHNGLIQTVLQNLTENL
jgi:DNA-binding transcriptional LysR family regulator